ncbi:MAG: outer membrane beta-barrel protein [Sulfurimonadaceae bacterium]|jgi:hypothetical protein|nr:outer membrane beta-barrel protein [Sulfurimonadaceae bacterium]
MKKTFQNLLLASLVVSAPLAAEEYVKSLVGFEGGYGKLNVEHGTTPIEKTRINAGHGGIKIGAESRNVRIFLSANYLDGTKFDDGITYGASLQYLLNFSDYVNFFAGPNLGMIDVRLIDDNRNGIKISKTYVGADAGFNIHLGKSADLELGARYSHINATKTLAGVNYELKNHMTAFGSLIFKFNLEK